jgi:tRNA pseudouridine38-40 synthase
MYNKGVKNIKLTLAFDGSAFYGFQLQPDRRTVQGYVEDLLSELLGEEIKITGVSRTDAGVHALGYELNFKTNTKAPTENLAKMINNASPSHELVAISAEETPLNFNARHEAKAKTYLYKISLAEKPSPWTRNYEYWSEGNADLDMSNMRMAAKHFRGEHDFSAFKNANMPTPKSTVRKIYGIKIYKGKTGLNVEITANSFLYNMARIIVGTLLEVGQGKREPKSIHKIFRSGERGDAGFTAPPQGLYLKKVHYVLQ